jgi:hypothetical protein
MLLAAVHESAIGTKRTSLVALHMSAFGGRADIALTCHHVRTAYSNGREAVGRIH